MQADFTPCSSGFHVGVSYARDGNQNNFGLTNTNSTSVVSDIIIVGANYVQSFGARDTLTVHGLM